MYTCHEMDFVKLLPIQYTPSTHLSFLYSEPQALCPQSKGRPLPENVTLSTDAVLFSTPRGTIRMFEKKCKRRAVSMDKSCPAVVLGKQTDGCKHRAVSMDKSCPVVVLRKSRKLS